MFRELSERITSVHEGQNLFRFLDKPWCEKSAICSQIATRHAPSGPPLSNRPASLNELPERPGRISNENENKAPVEPNPESCTPDDARSRLEQAGTTVQPVRIEGTIPETPETVRPLNAEGPITQVSSPRKTRSLSGRKRARDLWTEGDDVPVARSLIHEPSQPSEADNLPRSGAVLQDPAPVPCKNAERSSEDNNKADVGEDHVMKEGEDEEMRADDTARSGSQESRKRIRGLQGKYLQDADDPQQIVAPPEPATRNAARADVGTQ